MIYPLLLLLSDFVALLAAFTLAYILRVQIDTRPLVQQIEATTFIKAFLLLIPFWLLVNGLLGLYTKTVYEKRLPELGRLAVASFIGILIIIGFDFVNDEALFPARLVPVYGLAAAFALQLLNRNILWLIRRKLFKYGFGVRGVMIIGSNQTTTKFAEQLDHTLSSGYEIKAIVGNKASLPKDFKGKHFSSLDEALAAIPKLGIHTVIQSELFEQPARNQKIFEAIRNHHLQYKFIPAMSEFYTGKNTTELLLGYPVISVHQTPLIGWGRVVKRLVDFIFTIILLVPALPIILVFAIVIKATDPSGPVIYRHRRVTRFGTEFYIYKLRSMFWRYSTGEKGKRKSDQEIFKEMGREDLIEEFEKKHKVENDPRVMPIGRFIRKSSIDELPQLFNVLRGNLSLVGPRAMTKHELSEYRHQAGGDVVLSVKSGITGLWQVSGRSNLSFEERIRLELFYVQNWSLWLDLKILLKTIGVVLKGSGAR